MVQGAELVVGVEVQGPVVGDSDLIPGGNRWDDSKDSVRRYLTISSNSIQAKLRLFRMTGLYTFGVPKSSTENKNTPRVSPEMTRN